jgi:hypothetical protein
MRSTTAHPVIHQLYGIRVRTPWPVRGVAPCEADWDVELVAAEADALARAAAFVPPHQRSWWARYAALPDGSAYRCWNDLFEFLVTADARRIYARPLTAVDHEAMLAYLLVDALSFSMVRLGWEPLHATAVLTPHGVVAFLGNSGDGKSTLAASFIADGCRLVTDDMLVVTPGTWLAHPGPPRLKLFREMAEQVLGHASGGIPMHAATTKFILQLDGSLMVSGPHALTVVYLLSGETTGPTIQRLAPATAFPRVLAHTAGHYPSDAERLKRQFDFVTRLVQEVPVKTLSYRRNIAETIAVRDAVLADVACSST